MKDRVYDRLIHLIGRLAEDVFEEKSVVEHIEAMGLPNTAREALLREVAEVYGFSSSGYETQESYLESQRRFIGYTHIDYIRDLRNHALDNRPESEALPT